MEAHYGKELRTLMGTWLRQDSQTASPTGAVVGAGRAYFIFINLWLTLGSIHTSALPNKFFHLLRTSFQERLAIFRFEENSISLIFIGKALVIALPPSGRRVPHGLW